MQGRHLMIDSPAMGRKVHLWAYGHYGLPVIAFPSAAGFAHEWEKQGMISVLEPLLQRGRIKLYCPESNVAEAWTKKEAPLADRMQKHLAYERFVLETLVPFVREDCRWADAPMTVTGCSLGAMYAANFALKHPETFRRALCMSGRYLATALTGGESNLDVYFNNPLHYVSNLSGEGLARVQRNTHLTLVCGQGAYEEGCIEETVALGQLLDRKGIPNLTDIWGRESRHDWDWWHKQVARHMGRMFAT
jgi:esterase/lipase superfamily enzyme